MSGLISRKETLRSSLSPSLDRSRGPVGDCIFHLDTAEYPMMTEEVCRLPSTPLNCNTVTAMNSHADGFLKGHATEDDFEKVLRAHKEAKDETKSDQREAAAAFYQKYDDEMTSK